MEYKNNSNSFNEIMNKLYILYSFDGIMLRDIPVEFLSSKILMKAITKEPKNSIEYILELSEKRLINVDVFKYLKMLPVHMETDNYYYRYFKLDPVRNYQKFSNYRKTIEMANDLMKIDPRNIEIIYEKHKDEEICNMAFNYDMNLIMYIPIQYRTKEMCDKAFEYSSLLLEYVPKKYRTKDMYNKYIKDCASKIRVSIGQAKIYDEWKRRYEYLGFLKLIPKEYITQKVYDEMFKINPLLYVAFPDEFKTYSMSEQLYSIYRDAVRIFIPSQVLFSATNAELLKDKTEDEIENMYFEMFKDDPLEMIDYIPLKYRSQRIYNLLFEVGGIDVVEIIPIEFRTQEMWDRIVFNSNRIEVLKNIPEQFITDEMCDYLYSLFGSYTEDLCYVPDRCLSKEMIIDLINYNIYENLDRVSVSKLDEELLGIIILKLKKAIDTKKTVKANKELVKYIVKLYPNMSRVFDKEIISEIIENELYNLIANEGTIENIASKYDVGIGYVNGILESIKDKDIVKYDMIKKILDMNQNRWFYNMQIDVSNLDIIIEMLGNIKDNRLDINQKVKFAYLYIKYIGNSLEEIYNFNYNKYSGRDYSKVDSFFKRILKYNYVFGKDRDISTIPEVKTIVFNNSWLKKYDRNKFFSIKDGNATMERRYGKDSKLLTLEIEKEIINELRINNIPLNDIIVQSAFREYFNGRLDEYIKQFIGYDIEFENNKKERGR